ncbi:hypothetical protein DKP76_09645 [Falsochrobactrum shanghaiense]|uniref:Uncharacterized protein n=1 Tax=Falsochrobactrum shanghaiense TaxID=2201899 RepID=A0A316J7S9_9HYPH|nr:hypothetical protein DKP76_09645 [Falsochrobactrum shanghaiense]
MPDFIFPFCAGSCGQTGGKLSLPLATGQRIVTFYSYELFSVNFGTPERIPKSVKRFSGKMRGKNKQLERRSDFRWIETVAGRILNFL